MKALTICQPYAHLICATEEKLVENRTWPTRYRGPLIIHAGKSKSWLGDGDEERYRLVYGAAIGVCRLADCVSADDPICASYELQNGELLCDHEHTHGPWLWILRDVHMLSDPYPCKGAQGLWDLPVRVRRVCPATGADISDLSGLWDDDDGFFLEATDA